MDTIKAEPEVDPLAVHANDDADREEKKPLTEERNLLDFHVAWIKKECVDGSYDVASEMKFEESEMPQNLSPIKCEAEEESCDVDKARDNEVATYSMPEKGKHKTCYVPGCLSSNRKDPDLAFFHFPKDVKRAQQWTESLGMSYNTQTARKLFHRVICSRHFSETDFKTKERKGLNWLAVPSLHESSPITHSTPQPHPLSFILPTALILPEDKSTQLSSEQELKFLQPSKTYQRKSLALRPLSFTKENTSILPAIDNTFSGTESSSPIGSACAVEEGNINIPDPAP